MFLLMIISLLIVVAISILTIVVSVSSGAGWSQELWDSLRRKKNDS